MTDFKEGDEVLVKATVRNVYDDGFFLLQFNGQERPSAHDDPYVTNLVKNAENTLTVQKPEMFPASALDVNKQLLEALKPFAELAAMFDDDVDDSWGIVCESTDSIMIRDLRRARDALAAAEKGA